MTNKVIGLDLSKRDGFNKAITGRVGDKDNIYSFRLFSNGVLFDLTQASQIALLGLTPSGYYVDAVGFPQVDGTVSVEIPSAFNAEMGYFQRCFIRVVTTTGEILSSQDLIYYSYGNADISAGGGADYIGRVEELINQLNKEADEFKEGLDTRYNDALADLNELTTQMSNLENRMQDLEDGGALMKSEAEATYSKKGDSYLKAEADERFSKKSETYTKTEVDNKISNVTIPKATAEEVTAGVDDTKMITPKALKDSKDNTYKYEGYLTKGANVTPITTQGTTIPFGEVLKDNVPSEQTAPITVGSDGIITVHKDMAMLIDASILAVVGDTNPTDYLYFDLATTGNSDTQIGAFGATSATNGTLKLSWTTSGKAVFNISSGGTIRIKTSFRAGKQAFSGQTLAVLVKEL